MKNLFVCLALQTTSLFTKSFAQSNPDGCLYNDDPEIFTMIFDNNGSRIDKWTDWGNMLGLRIQFVAIGSYWVKNEDGTFSERTPSDPAYNEFSLPTYPTTAFGINPNNWIYSVWSENCMNEKNWYGFELYNVQVQSSLPDFAYALYRINVDILYFDTSTSSIDSSTIGYMYLDCRDAKLGNYSGQIGHVIDIDIKFTMPDLTNTNGKPNGTMGIFKIRNHGASPADPYRVIQTGKTIRYWELKGVTGPTEIVTFNYTSNEIPQNFTISSHIGKSPVLYWNSVPGTNSYVIYRAWEEGTVIHQFEKIGTTTFTNYTDESVITNRTSADIYHYKVHSIFANNVFVGYESSPTDTVAVKGYGPIFKGNENEQENKAEKSVSLVSYPNPFNPSTNIKFNIVSSSYVNLIIYDLIGNRVANYYDKFLNSGIYSVKFDGSNLTAGIYFCVLKSNNISRTIKLLLIK